MNSNFDDLIGVYGSVQYSALNELGHVFGTRKRTGVSWKRVLLVLAALVTPLAVLASGTGA